MPTLDIAQKFAIWVLPVLFAITVHEVAHGWIARKLGDPTAFQLGRLTLNPLRHIDPIGTVVVPAVALLLGGFIIGWAKPVPINPTRLRHPRRDMAWVALAGPAANLLMGIAWALVARAGLALGDTLTWAALPMLYMGVAGMLINMMLMVLNLLPLPPLDGGRVLVSVLPRPLAVLLSKIEPYGIVILVVLLATQVLGQILSPPLGLAFDGMSGVSGLSMAQLNLLISGLVGG